MYSVPILFIIFNRKEIAKKSFQSIKRLKPKYLYIACDGPRKEKEEDIYKVKETREAILSEIDWDCEVKTLFQESNLGCGYGVFTAINWLFENEEKGIILEDDCIASSSFFPYVAEMLSKYESDSRIGMISGYNSIELNDYPYSIIFSKFKGCWGWATWRRAWVNMDYHMDWRNGIFKKSIITNSGYLGKDKDKWHFELKCIDNNYVSAWDWQWYFSLSQQNQLCIFPKINQISNIGNDADATHTSLATIEIPSGILDFPLSIPYAMCPYEPFDRSFYKSDHSLGGYLRRLIPHNVKQFIKKILH